MDKGKNEIKSIDSILNQHSSLYLLYLKMQNQLSVNDSVGAKLTAKQVLSFDSPDDIVCYQEELFSAHNVLDCNYNILTAPRIKISPSEVIIDKCVLCEQKIILLEVTNTGSRDLVIYDILTSCSCLEVIGGNKRYELLPDETCTIGFIFTPDVAGIVSRDIIIISNAYASATTHIPIKANVIKNRNYERIYH